VGESGEVMELLIVVGLAVAVAAGRHLIARVETKRRLGWHAFGIDDGRFVEAADSSLADDEPLMEEGHGGMGAREDMNRRPSVSAGDSEVRMVVGWGERRVGYGRVAIEPVVWEPRAEVNPHMLILGASGSGKTQTIRMLVWELGRRGIPVLVIDFAGDQEVEGERVVRLVPGGVWGVNPLEIHRDPRGGGPDAQRFIVVRAIAEAFAPFGVVQASLLDQAIKRAYRRSGVTEDPATWGAKMPTMADVRRELEAMSAERLRQRAQASGGEASRRGRGSASEDGGRRRTPEDHLLAKIGPVFDSKVFQGRSVDVVTARAGILRLDLSKLPWELQYLVVDVTLRQVFRHAMLSGETSELRRFVVIDEAKLAMPTMRRDRPSAIVNRVVSEGRKYGIGVILATQSAEHVTGDVRRNIGAKLLLKHDETEIQVTARRFRVEAGLLAALDRPGVGLWVVGGRVQRIRVRGYDFREIGG